MKDSVIVVCIDNTIIDVKTVTGCIIVAQFVLFTVALDFSHLFISIWKRTNVRADQKYSNINVIQLLIPSDFVNHLQLGLGSGLGIRGMDYIFKNEWISRINVDVNPGSHPAWQNHTYSSLTAELCPQTATTMII